MMLISDAYLAQQQQMHADKPRSYGVNGDRWQKLIAETARRVNASSILDYGAGKRSLERNWLNRNIDVRSYDPAIAEISTPPQSADFVVSCDVLEHVEPHCLTAVLDHIAGLARYGVFLVIATEEANKHLPDGRNAHLVVAPVEWWLPELMARWRVLQVNVLEHDFLFVGRPRP